MQYVVESWVLLYVFFKVFYCSAREFLLILFSLRQFLFSGKLGKSQSIFKKFKYKNIKIGINYKCIWMFMLYLELFIVHNAQRIENEQI